MSEPEWRYFRAEIFIRVGAMAGAWIQIDGKTIEGVDYAYIAHRSRHYRPAGVDIPREYLPGFIEALTRLNDLPKGNADVQPA